MDPRHSISGFVKTTQKEKNFFLQIHVEKERKIAKNVKIISYGPDEHWFLRWEDDLWKPHKKQKEKKIAIHVEKERKIDKKCQNHLLWTWWTLISQMRGRFVKTTQKEKKKNCNTRWKREK